MEGKHQRYEQQKFESESVDVLQKFLDVTTLCVTNACHVNERRRFRYLRRRNPAYSIMEAWAIVVIPRYLMPADSPAMMPNQHYSVASFHCHHRTK